MRKGSRLANQIFSFEPLILATCRDGINRLEYTQFIAAAMDEQLQGNEELCWRAFKVFDKDDSGAITMSELQEVIESDELSKMIEGQSLAKIFESTDKDSYWDTIEVS